MQHPRTARSADKPLVPQLAELAESDDAHVGPGTAQEPPDTAKDELRAALTPSHALRCTALSTLRQGGGSSGYRDSASVSTVAQDRRHRDGQPDDERDEQSSRHGRSRPVAGWRRSAASRLSEVDPAEGLGWAVARSCDRFDHQHHEQRDRTRHDALDDGT